MVTRDTQLLLSCQHIANLQGSCLFQRRLGVCFDYLTKSRARLVLLLNPSFKRGDVRLVAREAIRTSQWTLIVYFIVYFINTEQTVITYLIIFFFPALISAFADYRFYRWCNRQKWALFITLTSWFWFYTGSRTLINTLESSIITIALSYFPWNKSGKSFIFL